MTDSLLMYAILALDSYNDDSTTSQFERQLGEATLLDNVAFNLPPDDSDTCSVSATAYEWDGRRVVFYRGTLTQISGSCSRLHPDEWKSGENAWLIHAARNAKGLDAALQWLEATPF